MPARLLFLALLSLLPACGFLEDPKAAISSMDLEQLECPWHDATAVETMPDSDECWCAQATPTMVPADPDERISPCDVQAQPKRYCVPGGGRIKLWHKIGAPVENLDVVAVACADVAS